MRRVRVTAVAFEIGAAKALLPLSRDERLAIRWIAGSTDLLRIEGVHWLGFDSFDASSCDIVVSSASGHDAEVSIIQRAKSIACPTVQVFDSWGPYSHRVKSLNGDAVIVIDEQARQDAIDAGISSQSLHVVGQPSWELSRPFAEAPLNHVAFVSQPVFRLYGDTLGYDERSSFEVIRQTMLIEPDLIERLLVVSHPTGDSMDGHPLATTLEHALASAGTIIGMFSSGMATALAGGRRVIALQPGALGVDRCGLSRANYISRVFDVPGLAAELKRAQRSQSNTHKFRDSMSGSAKRLGDILVSMAL